MNDSANLAGLSPFEVLLDYERRSLAHGADAPERIDAPGLWRGIGFRIGARYLASSLGEVTEILAIPSLAPVPATQSWLLGVANVRGNLIALVDLRQFLTGVRSLLLETSRVLVVRQHGGSVGLLVDEVLGQRNFSPEQSVPPLVLDHDDASYARYLVGNFALGDAQWGQFSMAALVRAPDFMRAAA
ncbi:MAG: chemotaxis protein CheW [Rudaea sp.]